MSASVSQRKAAIALSVLPQEQRRELLRALRPELRRSIQTMLIKIESNGWNDRKAVELALGPQSLGFSADGPLTTDALVALSALLEPASYARILASCAVADRSFLLSLLDSRYAMQTRQALDDHPVLPKRLAVAVQVAAERLVMDEETARCAE